MAFASAQDAGFSMLKAAVSPSHALPEDLLKDARSVIATLFHHGFRRESGVNMLTGVHLLLTYTCNFACDHCFLYCGPEA